MDPKSKWNMSRSVSFFLLGRNRSNYRILYLVLNNSYKSNPSNLAHVLSHPFPSGVAHQIENFHRDLLLDGGGGEKRKMHPHQIGDSKTTN